MICQNLKDTTGRPAGLQPSLGQLRPWLPELEEAIQNCSPRSFSISVNPKGQKARKDGKKEVIMKYRELRRRGKGPHIPTLPTVLQCEGRK